MHAGTPELPGALWRDREPKRSYDVVILGAGGHGPATARSATGALLECPWCGPREEVECHCGGQAHVAHPDEPPPVVR